MKLVYPPLKHLQFITMIHFYNRGYQSFFGAAVPFQRTWIIHVVLG